MSQLHVLFKVADAEYALPADDIQHIEAWSGATRVPGAPAWVAGLVQTRGQVVPVIDLRARFGLPPVERGLEARVVVVRSGERRVGLLVDGAREVQHIPPDRFRPPPDVVAEQASGFVKAVAHLGQRLLLLVDSHRIIGEGASHGQ